MHKDDFIKIFCTYIILRQLGWWCQLRSASYTVSLKVPILRVFSSVVTLDNFRSSDLLPDGFVLQKTIRTNILSASWPFQSYRLQLAYILWQAFDKYFTFSDSFVFYLCCCHVPLAEFCTSSALTRFHVFALKFLRACMYSTTFDDLCSAFSGLSLYTVQQLPRTSCWNCASDFPHLRDFDMHALLTFLDNFLSSDLFADVGVLQKDSH